MNKKILIIEDEVAISHALAYVLSCAGYEVKECRSGTDGLKQALTDKPDLILLDLLLPKMNGLPILKRIRKEKWGETVPVIIITNLSLSSSKKQAINKYKVVNIIIKTNLDPQDLPQKVDQILRPDQSS